jgi:16S rRNA (uracil1498-N3)-methyltransferase
MGHRFFASPEQISSPHITLSDEESHHLTRVMRLAPGAIVNVFDGAGNEYRCEVKVASRSSAQLEVLEDVSLPTESPLQLTLAQALVKNDKFDWVVQKATELGVSRIVPLITTHSEVVLSEGRGEKRVKRWERISLEALKQCGRRRLVEISTPEKWSEYCSREASDLRLVLSERGGNSLESMRELTACPASIALAIGPEGGWEIDELVTGLSSGFREVHLGPRILRAETAAIAAITLAQFVFGDLDSADHLNQEVQRHP